MRILHVTSGINQQAGGPASALEGLATAQRRIGLEVTVAATHGPQADLSLADRLKDVGVAVDLIGPAKGPRARHRDIPRVLAGLIDQADVVHIHALWERIQHHAARLIRQVDKPYLFRPCGMLSPWALAGLGGWKKRVYLAGGMAGHLNHAAALHFTTDMERDDALKAVHLRPRSIVEPNGVDLSLFQNLPPAGEFRRRYPQTADRPIVVYLGRICKAKGLEYLVPAWGRLANRHAMLVIIGPDQQGYRRHIEQRVTELHLYERVLFTGMLEGRDKLAALVDADLLALPSDHENFGVAVIEALAAGTPVIVSNHVGLHPQITSNRVGEVVPTRVEVLAEVLDRWLADSALRLAASERARPFALDAFEWDRIARRWAGHYQRLQGMEPGGSSDSVRDDSSGNP